MAERIVSPGVFTEKRIYLSYHKEFQKLVNVNRPYIRRASIRSNDFRNLGEFEETFGKETQDFYVPYTAKEYLRSAGAVTIVRVLGLGGYANDTLTLSISGSTENFVAATLKPSRAQTDPDATELNGTSKCSLANPSIYKKFIRIKS